MAPVFIPMFMLLGYSPELVQATYRIGDSVTNIISPMISYFALIVAFMTRYEKEAGICSYNSLILYRLSRSFSYKMQIGRQRFVFGRVGAVVDDGHNGDADVFLHLFKYRLAHQPGAAEYGIYVYEQ